MTIRFAEFGDLGGIIDVYNQAIRAGNATADTNELGYYDRDVWFKEHNKDSYPIYVVELRHRLIGWGSISPYRAGREGLKETAEISYYIDYEYHNKGYGKKLIQYMLDDCKRLGIKNLFALLLEVNVKSCKVLESFGFERWGLMPDIANLNGLRCGHLIYGKKIYLE